MRVYEIIGFFIMFTAAIVGPLYLYFKIGKPNFEKKKPE